MSSRIWKFESGNEKLKKKKRAEELKQSQKGNIHRYFPKGQTDDNKQNMDDQNLNSDYDNEINDNQNAYVEGDYGEASGDGHINGEGVDVGNSGANVR